METLKNLVVLGESWPEVIKGGRQAICVAAYSQELGFIRLYPARIDSPLRAWNIVDVKVERNRKDSRKESWKLANSKDWENINKNIRVIRKLNEKERIEFIRKIPLSATESLNKEKISLGIVRPEILGYELKETGVTPSYQLTLTGRKLRSKKDFGIKPYITYRCLPECRTKKAHNQQLLEWGVYMWLNKNKAKKEREKVFDNLRISDTAYEKYFVVGNLAYKRKTFAIINVIRFKQK